MNTVIGTCGICGGPVEIPSVWHGIIPPVPTCTHCGATQKNSYGPVLDMNPNQYRYKIVIDSTSKEPK